MPLKPSEWHKRFALQAGWTSNTRQYLYKLAGVSRAAQVLDVGCGTGILSEEIAHLGVKHPVGIDINAKFLEIAAGKDVGGEFTISDAHFLPFKRNTFDLSFCHYVLMWAADPLEVINQMVRVTKSGSAVLALAEPDYGGRIDYPSELEIINSWQTEALLNQGADPHIGRKIKGLFYRAGLENIEAGIIGAQWKASPSAADIESEWSVIQHDLSTLYKENSEFVENSEELKNLDLQSWADGQRLLYVPTFYALGWVPDVYN